MKKSVLMLSLLTLIYSSTYAQKYFTKTGKIEFDATASSSPEKIIGTNRTVSFVIDASTGAIQFAVLIKGFVFKKALMQEHFNENYMESTKFPKAEFKGTITNKDSVSFTKDGTYNVNVKGKLTIHGITRDVDAKGLIVVKAGKVSASADINILLAEYNVFIPGLVADKVAKTAKVSVACNLDLLKN